MQAVEYNKHLYIKDGQYYVKSTWLKYVQSVLSQMPRKFNYGVKILRTLNSQQNKEKRIPTGRKSALGEIEYYCPISMNQFNHLKANLRGEKTYAYTTKN